MTSDYITSPIIALLVQVADGGGHLAGSAESETTGRHTIDDICRTCGRYFTPRMRTTDGLPLHDDASQQEVPMTSHSLTSSIYNMHVTSSSGFAQKLRNVQRNKTPCSHFSALVQCYWYIFIFIRRMKSTAKSEKTNKQTNKHYTNKYTKVAMKNCNCKELYG